MSLLAVARYAACRLDDIEGSLASQVPEAAKCFSALEVHFRVPLCELFELYPHEVAALTNAGFTEELASSDII